MAVRTIEFGTLATGAVPSTPPSGRRRLFFNSNGQLSALSPDGSISVIGGGGIAPHSHPVSEVSGLQTALDGKAASSHSHPVAQLSDATSAGQQLLTSASAASQRGLLGLGWSALTFSTGGNRLLSYDSATNEVQGLIADEGIHFPEPVSFDELSSNGATLDGTTTITGSTVFYNPPTFHPSALSSFKTTLGLDNLGFAFKTLLQPSVSGSQPYLGNGTHSGASMTVGDRIHIFVPVIVPKQISVKTLAIKVGSTAWTTSNSLCLALYNTGSLGLPGNLVCDATVPFVSPAANAVLSTPDFTQGAHVLAPGLYWLSLFNITGTTLSLTGTGSSQSWLLNSVFGSSFELASEPQAINTFMTLASGSLPLASFDYARPLQFSTNTASSSTFRFRVSAPLMGLSYY